MPQARKNVFVLNSYHWGLPWTDAQVEGILSELRASELKPEVFLAQMDVLRQPHPYDDEHLVSHVFHRHVRQHLPDLVIATDDAALAFVLRHYEKLFAGVPIVFSDARDFDPSAVPPDIAITGVLENVDLSDTLEVARRLRPEASRIVAFSNRAPKGTGTQHAVDALEHLETGLPVTRFEDLELEEIASVASRLSANDIVFPLAYAYNRAGIWHGYPAVASVIAEVSRAPLFDITDGRIRAGATLGGKVEDGAEVGRLAAQIGLRILRGEDARSIPVTKAPSQFLFNYAVMRRNGIAEADLPEGSIVIGKPPSFYDEHRNVALGAFAAMLGLAGTVAVLSVNIARRRRAEEGLFESRRRLRFALESAQIGDWGWDMATGKLAGSPECARCFGDDVPIEGWSFQEFLARVCPEDRSCVERQFQEGLAQLKSWHLECRVTWPDASVHWLELRGVAYRGPSGKPHYASGIVREITERKNAEEALRQAEERYRLLVEGANVIVWERDAASSVFTYVSPRAAGILGYPVEDWYAPGFWYHHLHSEDRTSAVEQCRQTKNRSGSHRLEYRMIKSNGEVMWIDDLVSITADDSGSGRTTRGVMVDITERKMAESDVMRAAQEREALQSALRQRQEELERFSRLNLLSGMASGLAHELSQPLAAARYTLRGCMGFLSSGVLKVEDATQALSSAFHEVERASDIVMHMAKLSRPRVKAASTVHIASVLQDAVRLAAVEGREAGVSVSLEIAVDLPPIQADDVQIEQVALNLLRNAIESAREGDSAGSVTIGAQAVQGGVEIFVRDSGHGFTEEALQRLAEPFFTTKKEGMGLGLSICQMIAEGYGGRIHAENNAEGGATVRATFPVSGKQGKSE